MLVAPVYVLIMQRLSALFWWRLQYGWNEMKLPLSNSANLIRELIHFLSGERKVRAFVVNVHSPSTKWRQRRETRFSWPFRPVSRAFSRERVRRKLEEKRGSSSWKRFIVRRFEIDRNWRELISQREIFSSFDVRSVIDSKNATKQINSGVSRRGHKWIINMQSFLWRWRACT